MPPGFYLLLKAANQSRKADFNCEAAILSQQLFSLSPIDNDISRLQASNSKQTSYVCNAEEGKFIISVLGNTVQHDCVACSNETRKEIKPIFTFRKTLLIIVSAIDLLKTKIYLELKTATKYTWSFCEK